MKNKYFPITILLMISILLSNTRSFANGVQGLNVSQYNYYFGYETTKAPSGWGNPTIYFPSCDSSFINRYHIININNIPAKTTELVAPFLIDEDTPISSFDMTITYQGDTTSFEENDYNAVFKSSSDGSSFSQADFIKQNNGSFTYDDSPFKQYKLYINKLSPDSMSYLHIESIHNIDMINRLKKIQSSNTQSESIVKISYSSSYYPKIKRSTNTLNDNLSSSYEGSDPIYVVSPTIKGNISYEELQATSDKPTATNLTPKSEIKVNLIEKIGSSERIAGSINSDSNGDFTFSNIDSATENNFHLKDSKNELALRVDNESYDM